MKNKWTQAQTWRHIFRPRILIYTAILSAIVVAMVVSLAVRTPYKVNVERDRGVMARVVNGGKIENVYRLQVMNATEASQQYRITVTGLPGLAVTSDNTLMVESTQQRRLAVRVQAPFEAAAPGTYPIEFRIESLDTPGNLVEKSVFIIPR